MQTEKLEQYVNAHIEELYALLKELFLIPAPSHHEEKRAAFCKKWFDEKCGEDAYIDEALNVIFPYGIGEEKRARSVLAAHTDAVFADTEPMPYEERDGRIIAMEGLPHTTSSAGGFYSRFFKEQMGVAPSGYRYSLT